MPRLVKANQATAARRRVYFHLVDATDGLTPETGEAAGQPQISTNGGAWTNTGIGTLSDIGNGRYYADLTQAAVATAGDIIETRYKSANTAEGVGDTVQVVAFDPDDAASLGLTNLDQALSTTESNIRGADSDTLETLSDQLDLVEAPSGAFAVVLHSQDSQAATVPQATLSVYDEAGTTRLTRVTTGLATGNATVSLDAGTYQVLAQKTGYSATSPQSIVVSAAGTKNITIDQDADTSPTETRRLARQRIRYNSDNDDLPLVFQLVYNGAKITPTSATITIYAPGNTTALVSAQAMTVDGTLMTYNADTTTTASWPAGAGYRADIIVTAGGLTYDRHLVFDVVKYPVPEIISRDQLVALDDRLKGMEHDGDEDLSEVILACLDELQLFLETKAFEDGNLIENMILDASRFAVVARRYILANIFQSKGQDEAANQHKEQFSALWRSMLNGIKYDGNLDGEEDSRQGGVSVLRVRT